MKHQPLPTAQRALFAEDRVWADKIAWEAPLRALGGVTERHRRSATAGALVASLLSHGVSPKLGILSTVRRNDAASWSGGGASNLASSLVFVYVHLIGLGCVLRSAK
jgi:hypothetical protein